LERDLLYQYPDLPTFSLLHPTTKEVKSFQLEAYLAHPRVVQVGDWLRKLQAIFQIQAPDHEKVMLFKNWTRHYMEREIAAIGDFRNDSVLQRDFIGNEEYDDLLSSSVVLCLLYATAANNILLECMARGTPIIINPLPSVLEYLGEDYPLYATTIHEAEEILQDRPRIAASVDHLRKRFASLDLSYEGFQAKIAASEFYKKL
jgi:glycosyltransferase involved in cell wall biosynthesis